VDDSNTIDLRLLLRLCKLDRGRTQQTDDEVAPPHLSSCRSWPKRNPRKAFY
jgi:hypothetical protein